MAVMELNGDSGHTGGQQLLLTNRRLDDSSGSANGEAAISEYECFLTGVKTAGLYHVIKLHTRVNVLHLFLLSMPFLCLRLLNLS